MKPLPLFGTKNNPWTIPLYKSQAKRRYAMCGNRSGKTFGAGKATVWWATGTHPYRRTPELPVHLWCVALDYPSSYDVQQEAVFHFLEGLNDLPIDFLHWDFSVEHQRITFPATGSTIGFKSAESGWQKFQGTGRDLIWMDEEVVDRKVVQECKARLTKSGQQGELLVTMTPSLHGLTFWYRDVYLPYKRGELKDAFLCHATVYDNIYGLSKESMEEFAHEYSNSAIQDARVRGLWTVIGGSLSFDAEKLRDMYDNAPVPFLGQIKEKGNAFEFEQDNNGDVRLWERPEKNRRYVVGVDPSEGIEADFSDVVVYDPLTKREVAAWRSDDAQPKEVARVGHALARYFNVALLAVERNKNGLAVIEHLRRYPNLYHEEYMLQRTKRRTERLGWVTSHTTRPMLVDGMAQGIKHDGVCWRSREAIEEMLNFGLDEKGKAQGLGTPDDGVFSRMIAVEMGKRVYRSPTEIQPQDIGLGKRMILQPAERRRGQEIWA